MSGNNSAAIKFARYVLANRKAPSPPQLADITPDDWNSAVSYGTLVHMANLNGNVAAKKFFKKDVLECLLCSQVTTAETIDGKYNPEDYYKAIATDLRDNFLWTDTDKLTAPFANIAIDDGQSVLDAAKAFVKSTISVGGAVAQDESDFNDATDALKGNASASTLFNLCCTEVKNESLVTFSVAIITTGTPSNVLQLSVYAFNYISAAPVTDVLGAKSTADVPITLTGVHGSIKLDENLYTYIRDSVHKLVENIEGMYIVKAA